jgi:modulator of drug activity B
VGLTRFNPSSQMKILSINTHLTYPGWSEGKLNLAFMDLAKAFFVERGHQVVGDFCGTGL